MYLGVIKNPHKAPYVKSTLDVMLETVALLAHKPSTCATSQFLLHELSSATDCPCCQSAHWPIVSFFFLSEEFCTRLSCSACSCWVVSASKANKKFKQKNPL